MPNDPNLRRGCIGATTLRDLASMLDGLMKWHDVMDGAVPDAPCLRRVEMDGQHVTAHVSTGPDVGGSWYRFTLGPDGTWKLEDE